MGFLNDQDQRPGLLAAAALGFLFFSHVGVMDAPGKQIADQNICSQVVAVATELQHHVLAPFQVLNYPSRRPSVIFHQKAEPLQPGQPVVEGAQGVGLHLYFGCQVEHGGPVLQVQERLHPLSGPEFLFQVKGGRGCNIGKVQGFSKQLHVLRLDLTVADADDFVGCGAAPPGAFFVQGECGHL